MQNKSFELDLPHGELILQLIFQPMETSTKVLDNGFLLSMEKEYKDVVLPQLELVAYLLSYLAEDIQFKQNIARYFLTCYCLRNCAVTPFEDHLYRTVSE